MSYNFIITPTDTDSISFCKPDGAKFSKEESDALLKELNSISPELMIWELDGGDNGVYERVLVLRAKNYVTYYNGKMTKKGSAIIDPKRQPALKEFVNEMIDALIFDTAKGDNSYYVNVYHKYVKEILNVTDIKRWASRKTLSSTMQESDRTNETRILDALEGSNYVEGDRFYTFFKSENEICLVENFTGEYDKSRLLKSLYNTASIFSTVLPTKELFINYSLKTKQKLLQDIK